MIKDNDVRGYGRSSALSGSLTKKNFSLLAKRLKQNRIYLMVICATLVVGASLAITKPGIGYQVLVNGNHIGFTKNPKQIENVLSSLDKDLRVLNGDDIKYDMDIKFDYIIHAASNAHPVAFSKDPIGVINANVLGTLKLLEYSRKYGNEKFLFVSSSEVYGENSLVEKYLEDDYGKLNSMTFRNCYPESKKMAETIGVSYMEEYGINFLSARPAYIYGAPMLEDNSRANEQFLRLGRDKKNIVMKSEGKQIRSYCCVADCVSAFLYIILNGKIGEAYNIANKSQNISIREFAEKIAEKTGVELIFDLPTEIEKKGYGLIKNTILDAKKLEDLGWEAKYSLDRAIDNIFKILTEFSNSDIIGRKEIREKLGYGDSKAARAIKIMLGLGFLTTMHKAGKGKYRFKNENEE